MKKTDRYFGLRFERLAFKRIKKIAQKEHLSITSLMRQWIMERLEKELQVDKNE